jgi:hypothetical protein
MEQSGRCPFSKERTVGPLQYSTPKLPGEQISACERIVMHGSRNSTEVVGWQLQRHFKRSENERDPRFCDVATRLQRMAKLIIRNETQ